MNSKNEVTIEISNHKCSGCGLCLTVCPSETITIVNGKAKITGNSSLGCGHCMAICPESAIKVHAIHENSLTFNTFDLDKKWLPYGGADIENLAHIIASRRSCRNFKSKPVEKEIIEDLVKLGQLAPSGSNCQKWTFTCLTSREQIVQFAFAIGEFYKKLNRMAKNPFLRHGLRLFGKTDLNQYYENYYDKVNQAIYEMEHNDKDMLFHGAPACIVIASEPDASCPADDALLATQNILLSAHTMGIGTCLIGFAVKAIELDKKIQKTIRIPLDETVYSVIALGYPNEKYCYITGRKKAIERYY
ncbi:MAG: nitroreductase family protein [Desulfamplus sp.]|nr:nitroreductase family protein [Desulfamplus sp.]